MKLALIIYSPALRYSVGVKPVDCLKKRQKKGIVHIAGIKIFRLSKPYTPGMVTAEIELLTGIALLVYLASNHLAHWYDYLFGPFLFIACFAIMQRSLMAMIGLRYKDMFAIAKRRFGK